MQNVSSLRSYTPTNPHIKLYKKRWKIFDSGSNGILEFALIYDEINQLLLVNVLRARVREGLPKKVAVLLDFVQMRGGRALPKFFVHFSQTVY